MAWAGLQRLAFLDRPAKGVNALVQTVVKRLSLLLALVCLTAWALTCRCLGPDLRVHGRPASPACFIRET